MEESITEKDPNYRKKLELSYLKCLEELCNPCENWEEKIMETKFILDPETGYPKNYHLFELNNKDNIEIDKEAVKHSYVFKRSHFYNSFNKKRSRIKRDLIEYWKKKGYFIRLYRDEGSGKWFLNVSWRNN